MNIAEWCIRNNRTTVVLLLLVALAGVRAFMTMSRLEDPEFTIRTAVVLTYFPGASPLKVEKLVTSKLEKKIRSTAEVEHVTSQSMTGLSIIFADVYEKFRDMKPIWQKLRNKVADARSELPEGVIGPVVNDEFGDVYGVVVALTGDGYTYREMEDVARFVRDELLKLDSVAKVELFGTQQEHIFVEFSNARLAGYGVSPYDLAQALEAQNAVQPGGSAVVGPERIVIEATGEFRSVDQIRRTSLRIPGRAETIYLGDIAEVRRDFVDPPQTMTRYNGQPAIILAVNMARGENIIHMGEEVRACLDRIRARLPVGLDFGMVAYQPKFVARAINNFTVNLAEAFFFVVVVMLAFAGLRTGLVAGTLVPMAMLMCIALMPVFNVDLQQVSIASLIIALGMLVDNGVVVSENILVRLANGEERLRACGGAARELALPLLSASLTTIFAFLPIAIARSGVGEYCLSLFIVVTLTLLSSWGLSLTMVPMMCYYVLKPRLQPQTFAGGLYRQYRELLIWSLRSRAVFLGVVIAVFAVSLWAFGLVPKIFFPENEREMFLIDFWQPYGTDIRATAERAERLEKFLLSRPEVVSVGTFIGSGGPRWYLSLNPEQDNPNYAFFIVNTATKKCVDRLIRETRRHLEAFFPDCRHTVKKLESGVPVGAPIQIRISGADIRTLYSLRNRIAAAIRDVPGVRNVRDDWGEWTKKLEVDINQDQAKRAGLTSRDIALSLQTQMAGLQVTEFREGDRLIPVVLRSRQAYREELSRIEGLNVYSFETGVSVPLLHVARPHLVWQPSNILRRDGKRTMTVKVDVSGRFASDVLADIRPRVEALVAGKDWPAGYSLEFGGEYEESRKAEDSIMEGLPLAMGLLALVLIAQFNSIRRPLIIALTIPPMLVGITAGLLITRQPFGFMAMLGMISLMGIVVNNAIMMIDRIEIERRRGQTLQDAVVVAAQRRLRPILMTAITTIVGLIPLALQGGKLWRPMANVLIFGLGFATVLTLVLCPVLYSLFFRADFRDYGWNPDVLRRSEDVATPET